MAPALIGMTHAIFLSVWMMPWLKPNFKPGLMPKWGPFPNDLVPLQFGSDKLCVLSWNGRGICVHNITNRHRMGCKVKQLATGRSILALQEVHGAEAEIQTQMEHWLPGWTIFVSAYRNRDGSVAPGTGGMVLAFCP